jgi:alpha-N-arabinofuranosidase
MYCYQNPVIPGFNPDPSICRDGEDFYLVTSSFEFFPAVPIYHSTNLVNWKLVGHCLNRKEQVPLEGCRPSGGIYAPTLRKHEGMFYMTTTNTSGRGNFIVHAHEITGSWSDPAYVDQEGIDPSLLFDAGKVWFCSTGMEGGRQGILLCELDPISGKKLSPSRLISYGSGGRFPEAPHLYRIGDWYYLMLAEGGTEYGHMVTIQRSRSLYGPYEACPRNPILSHRNRGESSVQALGHADIVEDSKGKWWMVCLGIRPLGAMLHNLGRETFLAPLKWEDGWPIVGNDGGIEIEMEAPLPRPPLPNAFSFTADFSASPLSLHWNYLRSVDPECYRLEQGRLILNANEKTLSSPGGNPAFLGIRQQNFEITATSTVRLPVPSSRGGLTAFYNNDYHYDIYVERAQSGAYSVVVNKRIHDLEAETFRERLPQGKDEVHLRICAERERYFFSFALEDGEWHDAGSGLSAGLCTEGTHTMTFTGVYIGLFCSLGAAEFSRFTLIQ